jgi:hypothetical protein
MQVDVVVEYFVVQINDMMLLKKEKMHLHMF